MIRGDSDEYESLKKWCETLPFFNEPKSVTTCEVGVREGLGSHMIMSSILSRFDKINYTHDAIDPYGDLEYKHFDGNPTWKHGDKWTSKAPTYSNNMRDQMVKDFATNPNFKFAERSRKGTRIIIDDYQLCNFQVIRAALSYWDFKDIEHGKNKVCFEKIC